jgi:protocatechuate 3,4-dioxygenase beta subunit
VRGGGQKVNAMTTNTTDAAQPAKDVDGADFDETRSVEIVNARWAGDDERLRSVMTSLVSHLHAFVKEIEPTDEDWQRAIGFLTAVGHKCDDTRQEFILLSDVLGVSSLVEAINHRKPQEATDSTVLGPFHMVDSPPRELGANIAADGVGTPCVVAGTVRSLDGTPLPGALVDVWQANGDGFYDVQQPDLQPEGNLRGLFTADGKGGFWFQSVVPRYYPVPQDGPVAELLRATGRHAFRPAHIHFIGSAEGHTPVTTHMFLEGSPYLDSDAVFGVKRNLIIPVTMLDDAERAAAFGVEAPFRLIEFDIVLTPATD